MGRWWPFVVTGFAGAMVATAVLLAADALPPSSGPIPFENAAGLIVVQVRVNRGAPVPFILDTGATVTLLSDRFVREQGLTIGTDRAQLTGIGAGTSHRTALLQLDHLQVGTTYASQQKAAVQNLDAFEQLLHRPVAGILGASFLQHYRLRVDYRRRQLQLE